jgi:hypothetical protein
MKEEKKTIFPKKQDQVQVQPTSQTPPAPPAPTKWKFIGSTEEERSEAQLHFDTLASLIERLSIIPVVAITERELEYLREALFVTYCEKEEETK